MPLTAGTRLGPYEIVEPIGSGGMGEVYRARDSRVRRDVAIKTSAERFGERFEREARAVAALNHPNICTLYDVGPNYLVMELVEGPTIAERITEGAMPLEEALAVARQLADALEAAHEKGIIHRDLKPANIKITPDGVVKVLDFGLAKIAERAAAGDPERSPTQTMIATQAGEIKGTAAYMAPEQARGKELDKRADIWAFGVVLYEMLAGRRLFAGETISDTLVAVLKEQPEWNRIPVKVRRLLQTCLEKDPKRRLRDIGDVWQLLENEPGAYPAKTSLSWKIAAAGLAAAFVIALWAPWRVARPIAQPLVQLDLDLGSDITLASGTGPAVILSPDGDRIVFVSQGADGIHGLYTRHLNQPKATALAKTEGAYAPFFSPDGQWVGFFAGGKLKKTRLDGGEPVFLCDAPAGRGAAWGEDGSIIAALDINAGLARIDANGGQAIYFTELENGERTHRWPQVLPGGKAVLFTAAKVPSNQDDAGIGVVSLADRRKTIIAGHAGMYARYLPSGHLVYVTKGTLFAVPFDPDRLETKGKAVAVLSEIMSDPPLGSAQVAFSRSGTMLYRMGGTSGQGTIEWLDQAGKTEPLLVQPANYLFPRFSPDGSRLAYTVTQGSNSAVRMYDWHRGIETRVSSVAGVNTRPVWSPDGRYLIFAASSEGMLWVPADGMDKPQPFTTSKVLQAPSSFHAGSSRLIFWEVNHRGNASIRTIPVRNGSGQPQFGAPEEFLETASSTPSPAFSPDGRWVAYSSAESGIYEIWVVAFPDKGKKWQVSNSGGSVPVWSRNRRELFYRGEDQRIRVVEYEVSGDSFVTGKPRVWSDRQLANTGGNSNLDLAPDGKRFAVVLPAEGPNPRETQSHVKVVVNFFDEIRRRVAAQGK